jgi:hypothetical protein
MMQEKRHMNNNETTGQPDNIKYNNFEKTRKDILDKEGPYAAAQYVKDQILAEGELSSEDKQVFCDIFECMEKYSKLGRGISTETLKSYLIDIKGYKDVNTIKIIPILIMIAACGYNLNA